MGSSLGLALVNIFVDFYEDQLFENIHRSMLYYRYIDDTFALSGDEQEVVEFFNQLELLHHSFRFAMKKENDCSVPLFLLKDQISFLQLYIITNFLGFVY